MVSTSPTGDTRRDRSTAAMCRPADRAQSGWKAAKQEPLPAHWMHAPCGCLHSWHRSFQRALLTCVHIHCAASHVRHHRRLARRMLTPERTKKSKCKGISSGTNAWSAEM